MGFLSIIELITNTGLKSFQRPLATVPQPFTSRIHLTYLISLLFTNGKIKHQKTVEDIIDFSEAPWNTLLHSLGLGPWRAMTMKIWFRTSR